jgi:hypothetical protein
MKGQEEGDMSGNGNRGTKRTCNGATDHVLVELDIACRDANGTKSNCALRERAGRSGPRRVPRGRADGEGRTANVMLSDLRRQGLEVRGGGVVSGRAPVGAARVRRRAGRGRGGNE